MSNMPWLKIRAQDANGTIIPNAKLYTYQAGTNNELPTEAVAGGNNAVPLLADSAGFFERFFLKGQPYKLHLTDENDNPIWTEDNVDGVALDTNETVLRLSQVATTPLDYGALGDGVADESAAVQSAIDNAYNVVDLLGLTYRCDSALSIPNSRTLRNGTLDFSQCADAECITIKGAMGGAVPLTNNALRGEEEAYPNDMLWWRSGMLVLIESQGAMGVNKKGELAWVRGVDVDHVHLMNPLYDDYLVADTANLHAVNHLWGVVVEGVDVLCSNSNWPQTAIAVDCAAGVIIRECEIWNATVKAIDITQSIGCTVERCIVANQDNSTFIGINLGNCATDTKVVDCELVARGFGIYTTDSDAAHRISRRTTVERCRIVSPSSCAVFASAADCTLRNCELIGSNLIAVVVDAYCPGLVVDGCTFAGVYDWGVSSTVLFTANVPGVTITRNTFAGFGVYGIDVFDTVSPRYVRIADNTMKAGMDDGIVVSADSTNVYDAIDVVGNELRECSVRGIIVYADGAAAHTVPVNVSGNSVIGAEGGGAEVGIIVDGSLTGNAAIVQATVADNNVQYGELGISVEDVSPTIIGNTLAWGLKGMLVDAIECVIANNKIRYAGDYAISIEGGSGTMSVCGNTIICGSFAGQKGIVFNTASGPLTISVHGNYIFSEDVCLHITDSIATAVRFAVSGNYCHNIGNGTVAVDLMGSGAVSGNTIFARDIAIALRNLSSGVAITGNMLNSANGVVSDSSCVDIKAGAVSVAVSGNTFYGGKYGIDSAGTDVIHDGNVFDSQGTAITNGVFTVGDSLTT